MNSLPTELIFLLLIGGAVVFNFLTQRAARRQQILKRQQAEAAQGDLTELSELERQAMGEEVWQFQPAAPTAPSPAALKAWRGEPAPAVSKVRGRRRFSRRTLLGSRRQVQDAFVLATILGRCRGDEPHDIR
ncbi:MAG: hypothetical protein ABIR94_13705 [Rubrivivax sp.]